MLPLAPCSPVDPLPGVHEPRLWATAMHKAVLPLKIAAPPLQGNQHIHVHLSNAETDHSTCLRTMQYMVSRLSGIGHRG